MKPTLHEHLRSKESQVEHPTELFEIINQIILATKAIARMVHRARLDDDVLGSVGTVNVQGEVQEKLDVLSNDLLVQILSGCPTVVACASEEEAEVIKFQTHTDGHFVVVFDPLDGSSNIDVAAGVGTIFSVLPINDAGLTDEECVLQPGYHQAAAGYVLYGSSTLLVLTIGNGVDMYVLDSDIGEFLLVQEGLCIPSAKKIYSINEAYIDNLSPEYQSYLDFAHRNGYTSRYIGSMVADVHRTLLKGGVFLYPPTAMNPSGKLRLLYEANPMSLLIEQAGGTALAGTTRTLSIEPAQLHQRVPVILGSTVEVGNVLMHSR